MLILVGVSNVYFCVGLFFSKLSNSVPLGTGNVWKESGRFGWKLYEMLIMKSQTTRNVTDSALVTTSKFRPRLLQHSAEFLGHLGKPRSHQNKDKCICFPNAMNMERLAFFTASKV